MKGDQHGKKRTGRCFLRLVHSRRRFRDPFFQLGGPVCLRGHVQAHNRRIRVEPGAVSSVFSANMVVFAIALLVVGKLYDRYGPKWVIIISTLFLSAGLVLTSFMRSFGEFFFSYGILAAFGIAGTAVPLIATLTSKWFDKWRGFAISSALSGNSMGQFALVPLLSLVSLDFGWRASYLYIGIAMPLVNVFLVLFVIKGDPEHLGLKPFGHVDREKTGGTTNLNTPPMPLSRDMGLKDASRTSSFWVFALVMFICGGGDYVAATHLIPLATDYGIPPMTAGWMLSLYGVMSLAGVLIAGPAADVIGNKIIIIITFVMRIFLVCHAFEIQKHGLPLCFRGSFRLHPSDHRPSHTHADRKALWGHAPGYSHGFHQYGSLSGGCLLAFCGRIYLRQNGEL